MPRTQLTPWLLILGSVFFGIAAHHYSEGEALRQWHKKHFPSEKILRFAFQSHGFQKIDEPHFIQKALRTLPFSIEEKGSFWVTEDLHWIVYCLEPESTFQVEVFSTAGAKPSRGWRRIGVGWSAFEELDDLLAQKHPDKSSNQKVQKKRAAPRDPREITY